MPYQHKVAGSSGGDISRYLSPMKLFEYMACGRPILSSDLPVFREVLNKKNAILLTPNDVNQWVECIELLQSDPEQRTKLAIQAKQDVQQYTWEARAEHILTGKN
jgi:glycosyltransferase involved in cell wall biosynthesis